MRHGIRLAATLSGDSSIAEAELRRAPTDEKFHDVEHLLLNFVRYQCSNLRKVLEESLPTDAIVEQSLDEIPQRNEALGGPPLR